VTVHPTLTMLYYQFAVAPALDNADLFHLGNGMASVMVRCEDVNEGTARVLKHLAAEQWEVLEVRNARLAEKAEEFEYDKRLLSLYAEAEKNGIASLLVAPRSGKVLPPEEVPTM